MLHVCTRMHLRTHTYAHARVYVRVRHTHVHTCTHTSNSKYNITKMVLLWSRCVKSEVFREYSVLASSLSKSILHRYPCTGRSAITVAFYTKQRHLCIVVCTINQSIKRRPTEGALPLWLLGPSESVAFRLLKLGCPSTKSLLIFLIEVPPCCWQLPQITVLKIKKPIHVLQCFQESVTKVYGPTLLALREGRVSNVTKKAFSV